MFFSENVHEIVFREAGAADDDGGVLIPDESQLTGDLFEKVTAKTILAFSGRLVDMGIRLYAVMADKTDIRIAFFDRRHDDGRSFRSFFGFTDALKLVVLPVFLDDRDIHSLFDVERVIHARVHAADDHAEDPETVSEFVKFRAFGPDAETDGHFFKFLRTDLVIRAFRFSFRQRKDDVARIDDVFQVPEIFERINFQTDLPGAAFQILFEKFHFVSFRRCFFSGFVHIRPYSFRFHSYQALFFSGFVRIRPYSFQVSFVSGLILFRFIFAVLRQAVIGAGPDIGFARRHHHGDPVG